MDAAQEKHTNGLTISVGLVGASQQQQLWSVPYWWWSSRESAGEGDRCWSAEMPKDDSLAVTDPKAASRDRQDIHSCWSCRKLDNNIIIVALCEECDWSVHVPYE